MNNLISRKRILLYFILVVVFVCIFQLIKPYYLVKDGPTPSPIDSRPMEIPGHFFDKAYVIDAKTGYNIPHYYHSFLVLDLFFPVIYTLLFLSILQLVKEKKIYPFLRLLVLTGCAFDCVENISFAIFLQSEGNGLASFVAAASTIKSILVAGNFLIAIAIILWSIFKKRNPSNLP